MKKVVFFDMNETLLNLSLLKRKFDAYFKDDYVLEYWFTKLLLDATVVGSMHTYTPFGKLAESALESVFFRANKTLTPAIKNDILGAFRELPPHEDVVEALQLLRDNNIRVVAVSNSSLDMIEEQLTNAGIMNLFDAYYSVDAVQRYKPFQEVYQYVLGQEKVDVSEATMVATHDWDLSGAKKVGLDTAYVIRKQTIYNPYFYQPDSSHSNLIDLVQHIIQINTTVK